MSRILVADDDQDICEMIAFRLTALGHDVATVRDGEAALASARDHGADLVILDWTMPLLPGVEVCRSLRADPRFATVPIVMLTATSNEGDVQAAFVAGADDYVVKPFSPRDLTSRIDELLARAPRCVVES